MTTTIPRVIALAPSGLASAGPVVAACRAGALGTLDFGIGYRAEAAVAAALNVARYIDRPFGLRLAADELDWALLERVPPSLRVLICTEPNDGDWTGLLTIARRSGRTPMAEVTSRTSAHAAALAGAEALIVAGHEAGGRGAEESALILLQAVLAQGGPPVWVRGGIGPRSAAACLVAGAAGVVLDGALLMARESPLEPAQRERISRWDGGETIVLGRSTGHPLRVHARPGSPVLARLQTASDEGLTAWKRAVQTEVGWKTDQAWPAGQDAALASSLARRFGTVGGVIQAVEQAIDSAPRQARALRPFAEGAPLAVAHGTRYPIVQGPMTRVSDTGAFALAVADGGALPFLALALLRGSDVRALLADVAERLGGRPWGVGLLGFVPNELRAEQVAAILEARPPFALIAGGRPDQARDLERHGIPTYLHAPSPALLRQYLKDGARRFVLEGRECGGHVGPRSSLVLWEQAVEVVLEAVHAGLAAEEVHLLFAGGLHDARSAAAVAALAVPLAELGVKLGLLVGTAYLFTAEAVNTGAIVPGFQAEALRCSQTVLLETGPGHEVRVSPTPFAARFAAERRRLLAEGRPPEEVRETLETLNTGRLRVAAKGVDRTEGRGSPLIPVSPDAQHTRGVYMLGQAATLRDRVTTIAELHLDLCDGSNAWLDQGKSDLEPPEIAAQPADVAIIGMAAILPGAANVHAFWENTLNGIDAITEVPADRWDWRAYYDPDPKAPDKITSKWGGFLPEVPFDPLRYGMPPSSLPSIEPMQMLVLETVRSALDDAGYRERPFPRERTAVVLGAGGGAAQLAMGYAFRSYLPLLDTAMPGAGRAALEHCKHLLPEWTEDSFPGILLNVAAGRVANRFDLGGANYTVDAACGSSLAAAALAVRELESGAADMVILGGADTVQNPFTYLAFSKTHAFSPRGRCRPFDEGADGIVISEGVAALVLKRLADAERDGDRIYAVLKGLGASSDGRAKGLTAPRPEGQVRALERAYARSGVSPATVGYVEAHGTGTAAGDLAEVHALSEIFEAAGADPGICALGSVKSLIGHTKCAAGLAGLINASLALYHQVIPPTIGIQTPNPRARLPGSPFRLNTTPTPWLHPDLTTPRRAGVSAFGFGGTNFHAVLEAYDRDPTPSQAPTRDWPAELLVWRASDRATLAADLDRWGKALGQGNPSLRDLAHTLADRTSRQADRTSNERPVLAIVAEDLDDLRSKLNQARQAVAEGATELTDPRGVFFAERPAHAGAKVAFLFPGQGSQTPGMINDLAIAFPEARRAFETFDAALLAMNKPAVGPLVFPPPSFSDAEREAQRAALAATDVAQSAVGAASLAMLHVLQGLGVEPNLVAGHSYGELVALHAGGVLTADSLARLSEGRGRLINEAIDGDPGTMAALTVGPDRLGEVLDGLADVAPVNFNGPRQTVVSGTRDAVAHALERASTLGIRAHPLTVACAFHSPIVAEAQGPLTSLASTLGLASPCLRVYSNVNARVYPDDPDQIARQVGEHLARPVRFAEMITAMADDGARVFVEVGPGSTLSPLVDSILGDRPHLAVSTDRPNRPGVPALLFAIGRLVAAGVSVNLDRLTVGRSARVLDLDAPATWTNIAPLPPSAWLVNGSRARPATAPEPPRFGVGPALPAPDQHPAARNGTTSHPIQNGVQHHQPPASNPGPSHVVEAFQETMRAFLQTQRATMLDYLASRASVPHAAANGSKSIPDSRFRTPSNSRPQNKKHDHSSNRIVSPLNQWVNPRVTFDGNDQNTNPHLDQEHKVVHDRGLDRDAISARLLRIVQDRTGYPAEVLRLDLDMEADLGIDSIKRVEILGSLRDAVAGLELGPDGDLMDQLSRARTLGAIVDRVERASRLPAPTDNPPTRQNGQTEHSGPESLTAPPETVRRLVIEVVNAPLSRSPSARLAPGGVVLVTDDDRGVARALAADLRALGHPVVRVRHGVSEGGAEGVNLTSDAAVSALLDRVRERGPLAGIVHALPLRDLPPAGLDAGAWEARMGPEVRGLFLLARAAAEDLARSAEQGGAALIAATSMGGRFALGDGPFDFFPGQGAVAGLVKTLSREWPGVRARVVDLDLDAEVEVLAADLVHEVRSDDPRAEVGYRDGRRIALRTVASPLPASVEDGIILEPGDPVVITGGARGITAAVAADLARRWRPTLLLIGSSPRPLDHDDPDLARLTTTAELKAALHDRARRAGRSVGPAEIERDFQALRRAREIRANLQALRAAGSVVDYAQADVRDADALGRALAAWRDQYGPPAALIHGAGVIQDKLLRDKTPESFDRVLGTKLEGALTLSRLVDPKALKFAALFSSVAGRFGNRGQADYAAANEALNKLALWLDRRWPCRVVSMLWGPWSGVGMVAEIEGHLGRRGLGLIPPEIGRTRLTDELRHGRKGDVEVLVTADLGPLGEPADHLATTVIS